MAMVAKLVIVHGRVQGVGFRFFVRHHGTRLGVTGDVRNCPDSTVEITVEGTPKRVEQFLQEVRKGPPLSRIERVDVFDIEATGKYGTFLMEGW
jgi:acylphosphatase